MSVKKYTSVDQMPGADTYPPGDPENLRRLAEANALAALFREIRFTPGVFKFRSVEEASRHRQEREISPRREAR